MSDMGINELDEIYIHDGDTLEDKYSRALSDLGSNDFVGFSFIASLKLEVIKYVDACTNDLGWKPEDLVLSHLSEGRTGVVFNFKNKNKGLSYVMKVSKENINHEQNWNEKKNIDLAVRGKNGEMIKNDGQVLLMKNGGATLDIYLKDKYVKQIDKYKAIALALRKMPLDHGDVKPENIFFNPITKRATYFDPGAKNINYGIDNNIDGIKKFIPGGSDIDGSIDTASNYDGSWDFANNGFNHIYSSYNVLLENYKDQIDCDFLKESIAKCYESSKSEFYLKDKLNKLYKKCENFLILKKHLESIYKALSDDESNFSSIISDRVYFDFCNKYLKDEEVLIEVVKFFKDQDDKIKPNHENDFMQQDPGNIMASILHGSKNLNRDTSKRAVMTVISYILFPLLLIKKGHGMAKSYKRIRALSPELSFSQALKKAKKSSHYRPSHSRSKSGTRVTTFCDCLARGIDNTELANRNKANL